jgi:hypothetical protein
MKRSALFLLVLLPAVLLAGPSVSPSYNIVAETMDAGGKRTSSTHYTNDGSLGEFAGVSTVAAPAETMKHCYLGQLSDATVLQLAADPATVNEGESLQLCAWQWLDDLTLICVPADSIVWSVQDGPLTSISAGGLVTAAVVYQDTAATVRGSCEGITGTLRLTVLDSTDDNFGTYAGDGVGDDWQVRFFGHNNPAAAPLLDPDHDGLTNLFEFTAGVIPTDPHSVFQWRIESVQGEPLQHRIVFNPRLDGHTYTVKTSTTLLRDSWISLAGGITADSGTQRAVTDPDTAGPMKFYKVEITRP